MSSERDDKLSTDPEWLKEQYHGKGKSLSEVADLAGVTTGTIHANMERYGIERRSKSEAKKIKLPSELRDKSWLYEQYYRQEKTAEEIANELDVVLSTVLTQMNEQGMFMLTKIDPLVYNRLSDCEWLTDQYLDLGNSTLEIASNLGVGKATVRRYMDKCGIDRIPQLGENHHNYRHGFSRAQQKVRDRDHHRCQCCGIPEFRYLSRKEVNLDAHHITKQKEFDDEDEAHRVDNLIVLCRTCHKNLEGLSHDEIYSRVGYPFDCEC